MPTAPGKVKGSERTVIGRGAVQQSHARIDRFFGRQVKGGSPRGVL